MRRPSDDQLDTIISLLRGGARLQEAVTHQGLNFADFEVWLAAPSRKNVRARIERAFAQADLSDMAIISEAANTRADAAAGTWQAAKARMEMRRESEEGRNVRRINALAMGWE